ncbi:hypothetical protein [Leyella stercorea]
MKKILSLLSMLMITVTAFATSYTDKLTYKLTVFTALTKNLPAGELTIEPYGTSNYIVTAKGCDFSDFDAGNWDEIVCEDVAGTKDANGVTTITLDNPYAYRTSDKTSFSNTKLVVKFNGTKAYAHFEGKIKIGLASRAFEYTFGTDEGFEGGGSTGGGETGGEVAAAFEKVNFVGDGTNFDWKIPVNWDTQKIVMSINPSTCTGGCEDIIGLGEVATAWDNTLHLYRKTDGTLQGYFQVPGGSNNNTNPFDETNPIKVEVSKAKGFVVNDVVKIPASEMSALFALSTVNMGTGEGTNDKSRATYNYVKVVDKDWTEVSPVTVVDTKEFKNVAYTTSMGGNGTATVTFTEMSDGTFPMTFVSDDLNVKAENLTKGTDEKGRTTYTGTAKRTDVDVTFTVKAVVYGETTAQKLYMTMDNGSSLVVTVGEDPDYVAPEPEIEGTVVEGSKNYAANGSKFEWSNIAINWNKQKLVAVIDLSSCTGTSENILSVGQNIGSWSIGGWHFYYTVASKKMKSDYLATDGAHPVSDPKTGVEPGTVRIELSKAEGCTIDGVSYNALYDSNVTGTWQSNTEDFWNLTSVNIGSKEGANRSNAVIKYVTVVDLPVTVKEEKTFNEALYMNEQKVADAKVVVKEMSDETVNMSLQFSGHEYTSTELVKGTDTKDRTTYTGKVSNGEQTYDVKAVVYEKDNTARLYMTMITGVTTVVVGENPDAVTPEVTEVSNKTYTSNLKLTDAESEEDVVDMPQADVNIIKYSDDSYKITLKQVALRGAENDLVFVGTTPEVVPTAEAAEPLYISATPNTATKAILGDVTATFAISEVSDDEIKMGIAIEGEGVLYEGEFNYDEEEETPEVYTNNLHIYDAAAPETDLFQTDQAKVEFLATATGEFKLTLKDVTLNEKTQDLVFTGALPTPQPGGQDPLAEEGEGEVTPAEPAMVLNATADEATTNFFGVATYPTAVFNVSYDKNDNFMMTFTIAAGAKNYGGEFNYEKKDPETPDPELFCKENYVADGTGFEWDINVDWDTQKIVMSIDPSTCTGSCEDVIGLGAVPTAWDNTLHLYRTSADQQLQGYFQTSAGNNNTGKFAETAPFLVEVSKAQGFVVNNEVKIASSAMSYLFTLPTVKMGTGEGANDKSRATYNYVKVVDKDWTAPKDPDTGINATTVAEGEVEFFTVNGVKLNKLQKGLNIVRTADGKVKKVLVK